MMKNKWFKFFILSTAIFAVFAIKHLVVLDAIETTEVSYTEDTSPNEVLEYKNGVSFRVNNSGTDIPLYISQETLEETPEELVIEVANPEEQTIEVVNEEAKKEKETEKKTTETKQNNKSNVNNSSNKSTTSTSTKTTETKKEVEKPKETTKPSTDKPVDKKPVVPATKPPVEEKTETTIKEEVVKEPVQEAPVVEKNVFEDIVFVGDSIMVGLESHAKNNNSRISSAEFIAKGGISAYHLNNNELVTYKDQELNIIDALKLSGRKSIFISLGTNDLVSFDVNTVVENISRLCDLIKTNIPDANINIISTTYVANGKVNGNLSTSNVLMYNYQMKKFAERNEYRYINWSHLLNDDYGNLAEKYSSDNYVHLNEEAYKIYVNALEEEIK